MKIESGKVNFQFSPFPFHLKKWIIRLVLGATNSGGEHGTGSQTLDGTFSGIRFSEEEETVPLFFHRPNLFSNQVACFASDNPVEEVTACLKAIEREAGRKPEEKEQEIVRLDIDLLSCDGTVYKPKDLKRDYILRGLKQLL